MDYSRLDLVRRSATPIELDLVESFANGRITRRQFIKRASVIGLSLPAVSAVIAACSPGTPSAAPGSVAPGASGSAAPSAAVAGGTIRCAIQRPVSVDPVAMQDLGGYGIVAQSFEFLCAQKTDPADPGGLIGGPRDRVGAERGRHRLDVQAPPRGQVAARRLRRSPRPTSSRRWSASWRPATPA